MKIERNHFMKRHMIAVVAVLLFVPGFARAQSTAIVNATVIDGTGAAAKPNTAILIQGKKIAAVGPREKLNISSDAKIIDASGKYVMPGLIDTNVHLVISITPEMLGKYEGRFDQLAIEAAQVELKNGVTTVFDSWGPLQPLLDVRDRIRRGEVLASRIYVAGNIVGLSGPLGRDFLGAGGASPAFAARINKIWEENVGPDLLDDTPEEVRAEIHKYVARGIDFMKFAESSHPNSPPQSFLMFSPEVAKAIVDEGHKAGIIVQTHTTSEESLRLGLAAGIDMGQHCEILGAHEMPDDLIKIMASRPFDCSVLSWKRDRLDAIREIFTLTGGKVGYFSPEMLHYWQEVNIPKLFRGGVQISLSTDGGTQDPDERSYDTAKLGEHDPTLLGEAHFLWLESMVEKGMTPMQAIVAGTRNGASAYHHLAEFGTLEPGKFADLLILDADPLENISNTRKISVVMKEGTPVNRDALPDHKLLTR
jgi:imidazolonepropionase-like amidohydrolase